MKSIATALLLFAFLPTTTLGAAQGGDLKEQLAKYEEVLKSKAGEEDAIALMDGFNARFQTNRARMEGIRDDLELKQGDPEALKAEWKALEKEQVTLADAVFESFVHSKRKEVTQANVQMWKAGAYALGQMGELGAARLWKVFEDKKFKKETDLLGLVLSEIGTTEHFASAEALTDLLDHHEYLYIARAAEALGKFKKAPGALRREIVGKMVKLYAQYSEEAESNQKDEEKQEKFRKTSGAMAKALEDLTSVQQRTPTDWNTWFNEHKDDKSAWGD